LLAAGSEPWVGIIAVPHDDLPPPLWAFRLARWRSGVAALWRRRGDDVRIHREVDRMIYDASVCLITRWIATGAENAEVRTAL
jgi:hypothetical protein